MLNKHPAMAVILIIGPLGTLKLGWECPYGTGDPKIYCTTELRCENCSYKKADEERRKTKAKLTEDSLR